ncbi:MAG: tyrosine decarboxylase MfnA [Thaumarchaeota archaeon]|nr:tyrosine decarboxylase MfnA [Nitrososphaerota archaeon]
MLMNEYGLTKNEISKKLNSLLSLDETFTSGKIIGSMCTEPDSYSKYIYSKFLEKNIGDPGLFKGTLLLEKQIIHQLGKLLFYPRCSGFVVSGGTEANIMSMWSARNYSNQKHPEVLIPSHSHHSFDKAADLLGIKLVKIPCLDGIVDCNSLEKRINQNTIMIVGVAGTTPLGLIDPIPELSDIARDNSILLHIDASFGGFIIPFLKNSNYDLPLYSFKFPGVTSISLDSHKMGSAPIPSSCILFRNKNLIRDIKINVGYLSGGNEPRPTLLGTSPGASIISLWTLLNFHGQLGYRKTAVRCMNNTNYLYNELLKIPNITIINKPTLNIVGFKINYNHRLIVKALRQKGWSISIFPTHIRFVSMPHINRKHVDNFLKDLKILIKNHSK